MITAVAGSSSNLSTGAAAELVWLVDGLGA